MWTWSLHLPHSIIHVPNTLLLTGQKLKCCLSAASPLHEKCWTFSQALLVPAPLELPGGEFRGSRTPVSEGACNLSSVLYCLPRSWFPWVFSLVLVLMAHAPDSPTLLWAAPQKLNRMKLLLPLRYHESISSLCSLLFILCPVFGGCACPWL